MQSGCPGEVAGRGAETSAFCETSEGEGDLDARVGDEEEEADSSLPFRDIVGSGEGAREGEGNNAGRVTVAGAAAGGRMSGWEALSEGGDRGCDCGRGRTTAACDSCKGGLGRAEAAIGGLGVGFGEVYVTTGFEEIDRRTSSP